MAANLKDPGYKNSEKGAKDPPKNIDRDKELLGNSIDEIEPSNSKDNHVETKDVERGEDPNTGGKEERVSERHLIGEKPGDEDQVFTDKKSNLERLKPDEKSETDSLEEMSGVGTQMSPKTLEVKDRQVGVQNKDETEKKAEKLHGVLKLRESGDRDEDAEEKRRTEEGARNEKVVSEDKECLTLAPDKNGVEEVSSNSDKVNIQERKDKPNFPGTANKGKGKDPEQKTAENQDVTKQDDLTISASSTKPDKDDFSEKVEKQPTGPTNIGKQNDKAETGHIDKRIQQEIGYKATEVKTRTPKTSKQKRRTVSLMYLTAGDDEIDDKSEKRKRRGGTSGLRDRLGSNDSDDRLVKLKGSLQTQCT